MKIVQVIHGFPPQNAAGSEVYTYNLTRELAKEDEVHVFHRVKDPTQAEYEVRSQAADGFHVWTINNTYKHCSSFEATYQNAAIAQRFGRFLDEVKADIAHFGHVTSLSTTLIEEAKKRNIPVVFTLHDFWLFCQLGQLLKRDLTLCHGPEDRECARCLAPELAIKGSLRVAHRIVKRLIPKYQGGSGVERLLRRLYVQYAKVHFTWQKDARNKIRRRTDHIMGMCTLVDLFIAPSRFLLTKFVEFGVPRHKIVYHDYGFDVEPFRGLESVGSHKLRFGYIGTFIPSKGVHVLLQAFHTINSEQAELCIHGRPAPYHLGYEDYPENLAALGKKSNIHWLGPYDNRAVARILAEIDVLVVPSIWHENSPLTIHEAFLARVPVITSNIGGMAELVQDGVNGLLFEVGDSRALAAKMQMIIDNPGLLTKLRSNIGPVIPMRQHVEDIRGIYRRLVSDARACH